MMFLPILVCLFIAAFPLGYAVYRAWKLVELEQLCRSNELLPAHAEIDPYVPRDIYYDVARGQYREVKHEPPPPDAVPFYRVGYAEPASWRDSEGNKYEPPDYEVAQLKYPEWKPGEE